ncbi:MAG: VCBS repeat-containing protein [Deltaproteobacteria bacterium]|nr:VCBS repeat-containing protein [Deltaproteobacteria bacterium]
MPCNRSNPPYQGARALVLLALACGDTGTADGNADAFGSGDAESTVTVETQTSTATTSGSATAPADATSNDGGPIYDVGADGEGPAQGCAADPDMAGIGECRHVAPPDSFEADVQWSWSGERGDVYSYVTPLVANLTDDNADGTIDLCDIPDIVVVATAQLGAAGYIYILDGAAGTVHTRITAPVSQLVTPALGDLDGDRVPELITVENGTEGRVVAFRADGTPAWTSTTMVRYQTGEEAVALGDLDNDGDVEVVFGDVILDHDGQLVVDFGLSLHTQVPTLADMDDDDDLEIVLDHRVFHHDGTLLWDAVPGGLPGSSGGYPQVADLDDDPEPEVLLTAGTGLAMFEHDGAIKYLNLNPTGDPGSWARPATVHDFDGDGISEFASSSRSHYSVFEGDASIVWTAAVQDLSGDAGGTAFDFLGDGSAEAMYADEKSNLVYDSVGAVLLQTPRTSRTNVEYPVVADVDNDGSAEIVVVSNDSFDGAPPTPTVQVIRDAQDRWIQARRVWNQHTYHVTNVREDGTIPQVEAHHWEELNTFRTNAQIEGGDLCMPHPAG